MSEPIHSRPTFAVPQTGTIGRGTIALLAGLAALGSLATNIILPAFPQMGADLGVTELESVETIVPTYLWRFRPQGQFHEVKDA